MDYLSKLVRDRLGLAEATKRRLLDIGGGTGNFTKLIVQDSPQVEAVVVDPFLEETDDGNSGDAVKFVKASAESLAQPAVAEEWWKRDYHQVLMKEVVHHLESSEDRVAVFEGIVRDVSSSSDGPGVLIITRPQVEIDYPLWAEARQVWADNQPSATELESELKQAGFTNVSNTIEAYPCDIELERWLSMVRGRFWSTFSNFSDEELEEACDRMRKDEADRVDEKGVIRFEDRLVFISASK